MKHVDLASVLYALRACALGIGVAFFYVAFLTYPSEAQQMKSRLGDWWLRLAYREGPESTKAVRFLRVVAKTGDRVLKNGTAVSTSVRLTSIHGMTFSDRRSRCAGAVELPGTGNPLELVESVLDEDADYLHAGTRIGHPLIAAQIEKFAVALATRRTAPATFRDGVVDVTRALLADGRRADRATVARRLHVSRRTLQRRLEDERTSFRAVRDGVLQEVVEALLSNPSLKVEAVAVSVGFADVAAFSKTFKRWTGTSPTRYRERLAANEQRRRTLRIVRRVGRG